MRLVMLGFPGAGKGTQAQFLAEYLAVPSLSSGDLFRRHQREGTPLGQKVKEYVDEGLLVPDDITIAMMWEEVFLPCYSGGFVLDGLPRNLNQAQKLDQALAQHGTAIDRAVLIDVTPAVLAPRLGKRLVCASCHAIYHADVKPPGTAGVCDRCSGRLERRADDAPEAIARRLQTYQQESEPVVDFYDRTGKLVKVDGADSVQVVRQRIQKAILV